MKSLLSFKNYKSFLLEAEQNRKSVEKGFRSKLAEALGCQSGYVTHVLNGDAHFSLEQALKAANFLQLNELEKKFFLLLVEHARAGTEELQVYFQKEINHIREEHLDISKRVKAARTLDEAEQTIYYSSWHYSAIHIIVTIPSLNTAKAIQEALRIPPHSVTEALLFLTRTGLLEEKDGEFKVGHAQIHLSKDSNLIRQHRMNWRVAAMQFMATPAKSDLHYSTVSSLSLADMQKIRSEIVALVERYVEIVKPSKEETLCGFNVDFYSLLSK